MGWTNYISVPSLKLLIEVSRHLNQDFLDKKFKLVDDDDSPIELDKNYNELSINDLYSLIKYYDESTKVSDADALLLYWLNSRGVPFTVISESQYIDSKDSYSNWRVINKT